MKTAILFGASGFVGSYLLEDLLNDSDYSKVIVVVRKDLNIKHPKLETIIGDYQSLPALKSKLVADEIFIAIGTTKAKTPDKTLYYQIDHDYPVLAAQMVKENGGKSVFLVSAVGANATSGVFYIKLKGETERDIEAIGFDHTHIFRPSLIMGNRNENRTTESIFMKIWSVINPVLIGGLNKYKGIDAKNIAKAMIQAAKKPSGKVKIYYFREMDALLK